jgi:chromate transporter
MLFCRHVSTTSGTTFELRYTHRVGLSFLAFFAVLLAWAFVPIHVSPLAAAVAAFYRAGALVFGGGHVVLPLLDEAIVAPGWINEADFLTGYGLAQALPGPMFSVAAFLGARLDGAQGSLIYPLACVLAILLPGLLLVASALPAWHAVARHPNAARALAGINAAVVGLLAAALYDPVWTSAVLSTRDFAIAIVGFALLVALRASPLLVLVWCVAAAML